MENTYPGAAALTRRGGGTGFRWIEEAVFASSSSLQLRINGADTYRFVVSNPVVGGYCAAAH